MNLCISTERGRSSDYCWIQRKFHSLAFGPREAFVDSYKETGSGFYRLVEAVLSALKH